MPFSRHSTESNDREVVAAPPVCPQCQSRDTSSAAKRPTAASYWRCLRCGEVWNPSLLVRTVERRFYR